MHHGFCWYELRTLDPDAALAFYRHLLGEAFAADITRLPEAAAARGAPSHWLGHIDVGDLDAATRHFVSRGAERLGPPRHSGEGVASTVLRDPFGAVLALTARTGQTSHAELPWHVLHTREQAAAFDLYRELFDWRPTGTDDLGPQLGTSQRFTWHASERSVGAMTSGARLPGVHPHWLFSFSVTDLDHALAKVIAAGGTVAGDVRVLPDGARTAYCEDPHRAAFGLREAPRP